MGDRPLPNSNYKPPPPPPTTTGAFSPPPGQKQNVITSGKIPQANVSWQSKDSSKNQTTSSTYHAQAPGNSDYSNWNWEQVLNGVLGLGLADRTEVAGSGSERWTLVEVNTTGDSLPIVWESTWEDGDSHKDVVVFLSPWLLQPGYPWDSFAMGPYIGISPAVTPPHDYRGLPGANPRTFGSAELSLLAVESWAGGTAEIFDRIGLGLGSEASQFQGQAGAAFQNLISNLYSAANNIYTTMTNPVDYSKQLATSGGDLITFLRDLVIAYNNWQKNPNFSPLDALVSVLQKIATQNDDGTWSIYAWGDTPYGSLHDDGAWVKIEADAKSLWLDTVSQGLDPGGLEALQMLAQSYQGTARALQPVGPPQLTQIALPNGQSVLPNGSSLISIPNNFSLFSIPNNFSLIPNNFTPISIPNNFSLIPNNFSLYPNGGYSGPYPNYPFPNGSTSLLTPNGGTSLLNPNGGTSLLNPNGGVSRLVNPNGTIGSLLNPNGSIGSLLTPNGSTSSLLTPGGGASSLLNPNGSLLSEANPNGNSLLDQALANPNGNSLLDQALANPNANTLLNQALNSAPNNSALDQALTGAPNNSALDQALTGAPNNSALSNALTGAPNNSALDQSLIGGTPSSTAGPTTSLPSGNFDVKQPSLLGSSDLVNRVGQGPLFQSSGASTANPAQASTPQGLTSGVQAQPVSSGTTVAGQTGTSSEGEFPFYSPMGMGGMGGGMGGMGGGMGGNQERERSTWLAEDEDVWGTEPGVGVGVLRPDTLDEPDTEDYPEPPEPTRRPRERRSKQGGAF